MTRIDGYDLARALAILGMVVVNFTLVMTMGHDAGAAASGPEWLRFLVSLFEGRAAAVFVVLAGVGLTLSACHAVASGDLALLAAVRTKMWKRAAFLFVGGLLFAVVWPADILHLYGCYLAIGVLFLTAPWTAPLEVDGFG